MGALSCVTNTSESWHNDNPRLSTMVAIIGLQNVEENFVNAIATKMGKRSDHTFVRYPNCMDSWSCSVGPARAGGFCY